MGSIDVSKVFRVGGRLSYGATNLATAWPHGGTGLGAIANAYAEPGIRTEAITAEEWGGDTAEILFLGEEWRFGVLMRQWDNDALNALFITTAAGASGSSLINISQTRAGTIMSGKGKKLVFTPEEQATHPGLIFYNAVPLLEPSERLRFTILGELVMPVLWLAMRDASGNVGQVGKIADLTVSP